MSIENNDILYVFGGIDDFSFKYDLWEFYLIDFKWNFLKDYQELSSRAYSTMTSGIFDKKQVIAISGGKTLYFEYYDINV